MERHPELARAERALLAQARLRREAVTAGALTAYLVPGAAEPLLQLAAPNGPEPDDWTESVEALLTLRGSHGVVPRLEFMEELHPGLPEALSRAGFQRSARAPVMVAHNTELVPVRWPHHEGDYLDLAKATARELSVFVDEQSRAYGMPASTGHAFLPRMRAGLADGSTRAAALRRSGQQVSGASLLVAPDGAELAGVWTAPEQRRRGLATALCARLLKDAAASGVATFWLSAAADAAVLYRRLGFRPVGTQLNFDPPGDSDAGR